MSNGSDTLPKPMIRMQGINKCFLHQKQERVVLQNIDLQVNAGEFISIMGPSGSGKSSLLNILGMLDDGFQGEYWLLKHAIHQLKHKQRQLLSREHIGFVFQHYHLLDDMTVSENIELILTYRQWSAQRRKDAVTGILERFSLCDKRLDYPNQLSGGQQQLVAVARAVAANPAIILADEPTGALHSQQGQMIMQVLKELNEQGTTIIQVTHNPENASYGNRTIELLDGQLQ